MTQNYAGLKYHRAMNPNGDPVDVFSLTTASPRQGYICGGCGHPMLAKLGPVRVWHFAHKPGTGGECSEESYLHIMAKNLFFFRFKNCRRDGRPFPYERVCPRVCRKQGFDCRSGEVRLTHDLAALYDTILLEQRWGRFVPDLTLRHSESGKECFVEIRVSHAVSRQKEGSGLPIIELTVASEDDLTKIAEGVIVAELAREYNIGRRPVIVNDGAGPVAACPCLAPKERGPNPLRTEADFERLKRRTEEVIERMRRTGKRQP